MPRHATRRSLLTLGRRVGRLPRIWARSLMVRAVFFTGLLTIIGTGIVAYFMVQQVTTGLYQERLDQVQAEATAELSQERTELEALTASDRAQSTIQVDETFDGIGGSVALHREVLLIPLEQSENLYFAERTSNVDLSSEVISQELRSQVLSGGPEQQHWQPVGFQMGGQEIPGVAYGVGVQLPPGHTYGLFFVYDFSTVQENVNFVFRTFLVVAGFILLLNMAIAAWITHTVVRPVQQAAKVSERIAEGQLDQRLAVVGEDEIARLGLSFNRMASTLQDQITQLANLSKMQQRFVSDVSHELRTPLSTIGLAATMLHAAREDFDPMNRRSAELLHHQVERFEALLADLLEMSRFDAGAAELALSEVDLLQLLKEVVAGAAPLAEQNGTELYIVVSPDTAGQLDFVASVDRRRIDRILRNLVNNAIEHAEGKPVDVIIDSSPTAVGIAVRDSGIGMTPDQVTHVFDRFWRADPARARTTGGSGLGLSIATEDTRLHQGSLDAWGQTGRGSCFRLVLPRRQDESYRASPLAIPPIYKVTDRQRVDVDAETSTPEILSHDRVREQSLYRQKEGT